MSKFVASTRSGPGGMKGNIVGDIKLLSRYLYRFNGE